MNRFLFGLLIESVDPVSVECCPSVDPAELLVDSDLAEVVEDTNSVLS